MLNIRPSVNSLKSQIEALRTQVLNLSDDPEAIAELDRRLAAIQEAANVVPNVQRDIANLQAAIEQAVRQEQMDNMATTDMVANVRSMVEAIRLPDLTPYVTTTELNDVAVQVSEMNEAAMNTALADIRSQIPNISGLASSSSVSSLADTISKIVVPSPATQSPPATDLVQQIGTSTKFAREDHTHKARIKRASVVIGANGYATWTFPEPFATVPVVSHMVQEQAGANRVNVIITSVSETSVTVYADRLRNLPILNPVAGGLTALLSAVITSVNGLVTALSGFNLSGGPNSAVGVKVHLYAAEPVQ